MVAAVSTRTAGIANRSGVSCRYSSISGNANHTKFADSAIRAPHPTVRISSQTSATACPAERRANTNPNTYQPSSAEAPTTAATAWSCSVTQRPAPTSNRTTNSTCSARRSRVRAVGGSIVASLIVWPP